MTSSSNGSTVTTNNKQLDAANGLAAWKALLNPQMLRQNDRQLDKVSRNYLQSLLRKWVAQAQLSPKLVTTLYFILLRLFEVWNQKAVTTDEKKPKENDQQQQEPLRVAPTNSLYSALYFECLPFKSLNDSRFLPAAQHGDPLSRFVSDRLLRSSLLEGFTGTIRLYGISSSIDQQTLANIVAAGIYTLWNMWLESFVMRDHQIVYPSPNTSQTKEYSKQEATISPPPTSTETTKNSVRDSLLRWLFGDATKRNHAKTPEDDHENAKPARKPSVSLDSSVKNAQAEVDNIPLDDTHRFRKLRIQLQDAQISSSPYVHFTTPRLLSRLQDEEDGFDTVKSVMQLNGGSKKTQSASFVARSKQNLQKRTSSIISLVKKQESSNERPALNNLIIPQHITAYSPLRSLGQICDKKIGLDHLYLETNNVDAFIKHQSIVLSLTSYPIGRPNRPCCGPTLCRISYFRFQSDPAEEHVTDADRPLGEMILQWCQQSGLMCKDQLQRKLECALRSGHSPESLKSSCSDTETASTHSTHRNANGGDHRHLGIHGCQQLIKDHVLCFSHNAGRINVFFASTDPVPQEENDKNESVKSSGIEIWQTCAECDQATHPVLMSKATYQFSFAKYLEFLLYNDKFATAPALNCYHANTKSNIIHQFRALDIPSAPIVKITYEEAPLYELRTPRLQVIPDAPKLKEHTPVSQSVLKRWKAQEEQDVNDFFQYVATHLDVMDNYVAAETKRETRSVTDQKRKGELQDRLSQFKEGLSLLRKSLLQDEKTQLQVELDKTPIDSLNDFRRLYSFRSSAILTRLREWQQKWCPDLMDECTWEPPDYMTDNKIHCFPGSSILVRQDEPSSIIAYTLSSNEYLTELKHALPVTPTDQTKAPSPPEVPTGKEKSDRVIDGYYSTTTRKYVAPSTGAASESASFRTMVMETVKANANELQYHQHRRLQGLRDRLSAHRHKNDNNLLNDNVTQRTMQTDVTEVKVTAQYPPKNSPKDKPLPPLDDNSNKNNNSKVQEAIPNTNGTMENTPSPHIKHKYTHNGIEFTCIVYYAEEFEALRKQCGIDQLMVQSLSRCTAWNASGGKSKSRFYKSKDNRLVIKEMVNAWNNVEKESILKFTPKYLAHMRQSAGSPSLLVKIFGFYTIRIKSTHDKRTLLNLDVLVMEHLFYGTGPKLSMTFDLKGIRDRHVDEIRKQQKGDTTLWDGDWLDGYRLSFPVNEHSKALVEKCIRADADFLSKGNIMDYSLLVGVDDDKKELTVGIVDFIGAYTWYKKVESKSKSTLHPNKEVTVLPPEQYKWRFCRMIDDYFVAVPDKFDLVDEEHVWSSALI